MLCLIRVQILVEALYTEQKPRNKCCRFHLILAQNGMKSKLLFSTVVVEVVRPFFSFFRLYLSDFFHLSLCFSQTPEELEDDSDFEQEDYDTRSRTSVQTEDDQLIAGQSARVSGCPPPFPYFSENSMFLCCKEIQIKAMCI